MIGKSLVSSLFSLGLLMCFATGCAIAYGDSVRGSGVSRTEARDVDKFDRVSVRGSGTANITIGREQSVTVTADDNILPILTTEVKNGELVIQPSESISPKTKIVVDITVPSLKAASIAGSGDVVAKGLAEEKVELSISGSGDVKVSGSAKSVQTSISGSGSIDASDLAAKDASVRVAGSGETAVNASENLDVRISGSGDVRYVGKPKNIQRSISGSGSVRQAS
jgi:hypothetical protein